jgi:hypothetical protein
MWRRTFAHEIGHNLGLDHPPKDDPLTTNGDHWFDVYDRVIKPVPSSVGGDNLLDLMVPKRLESEAWISPTNYNYLVNQLCSASAAAAVTESSLPQAGSDNLVISGSVGNTDPATGTLDPLFGPTTAPTTTLPAGSQYCVNLEDALENVLSSYCFNVSFDDDSDTPASAASFSMVVPDPTGLYRIELTKSTSSEPVVLSSQTASAHPPSVTVTYPNAAGLTLSGNQTITWTGSDLDSGSSLTYDVLYSHDKGTTWMGIGAGITGTSYAIDFSSLPGTNGANGLIEVMVSDGFYSAQDTLNNPFTVDNKPPSVSILSPFSGASFYTGTKIVLEGDGIDLQDGLLSNSALNWVSSKDGALGTGQMLEVNLSPGTHTITLKATDSQGLYATASTQLTVVQNVVLPGAFNKSSPANAATGQPNNPTLKWGTSSNATSYEYCLSTTACTAASTWTSTGTATSKALSGLTPGAKYYWQVRARNASGVTYANANLTASWSFTVTPKPGMFAKTSPANAATNQSTSPTLKWGSALAATRYDYCLGTVTCTTTSTWTSTGTATSKALSGLKSYKTYYWQVRAVNSSGSTYANGGAVWSFKTAPLSATFQSVGTYDGWVLESTAGSGIGNSLNTTAATLLLGDDKLNRQYRDILSFNTASLPDTAVITQVTLKVMQQPIVGTNPFTALGALNVDIRKPYFGTTVGLVADDFQATASKTGAGSFGAMPVSGWYTANLGSSANPYVNKSGTTQFRLRFATASNKNSVADIINLFSGNASIAADRPVLIIQYYAP